MVITNLLKSIELRLPTLNKSEKRVARVILADPQSAIRTSIAALAEAANVSEPTVNRFCRNFESKGFPDFKLDLAQSLVSRSGIPYVTENVAHNDNTKTFIDKIFQATLGSLEGAWQDLNASNVERAVELLIQAKQIVFCGLGASAAIAKDAQHKFFRFNIPVSFYDDDLMQRQVAASLHTSDVLVAISNTGRTKSLIEVARIAKATGATVLSITAVDSILAKNSTLVLGAEHAENTDLYMPMTSRFIHLAMIDLLATGMTLKRGPDFQEHLKKIKNSVLQTRFDVNDGDTS